MLSCCTKPLVFSNSPTDESHRNYFDVSKCKLINAELLFVLLGMLYFVVVHMWWIMIVVGDQPIQFIFPCCFFLYGLVSLPKLNIMRDNLALVVFHKVLVPSTAYFCVFVENLSFFHALFPLSIWNDDNFT